MASRWRKKGIKPKSFESTGPGKIPWAKGLSETFLTLYESQLRSPAFRNLSVRQRLLYVYMKSKNFGKRKPIHDYPELDVLDEQCFYFSRKEALDYNLYSTSTVRFLYSDVRELEKAGLITIVASGKPNKQKSIYRFSDEWKNWKKEENI